MSSDLQSGKTAIQQIKNLRYERVGVPARAGFAFWLVQP
jgi:hypothetical protein